MSLSRRNFLKVSSLTLGAALLPPVPPDEAPRPVELLGRAIKGVYAYDRPSFNAKPGILLTAETVFNIYAAVQSDDQHYNRTWYRVQQGYVHSGLVQPVRWELQTPALDVPKEGFLGEVTVPYTTARTGPYATYTPVYRFYYGTTHWIVEAKIAESLVWYKVYDERLEKYSWVRGEHLRRVTAAEITPLSPDVRDKRIEVDLEKQTFRCFENGVKVLDVLCSTGPYLRTENGKRIFGTPSGEWQVIRKRPSRHMAGDDFASADFFDLPGVPWVSYFHWWGVSIHGTYWHNDYGRPRSHGCINLPPETAKWVYRWTLPVALLKEEIEGRGTQVVVA